MKIAIIGCGVMGSAIARHLSKKHTIILCNRTKEKAQLLAEEIQAEFYPKMGSAIQEAEVVILAVQLKDFYQIAKNMKADFSEGQILISILSGVSIQMLKHQFPLVNCIRAMPNLALICSQAVIGLSDNGQLPLEIKKKMSLLLEDLGLVIWIPEQKIEALASLNASGLGFVFLLIESMVEGGIFMGFDASEAKELVLKTMEGSIALLRETKKHPAELKWQVCSPEGTTIAGIKTMEEKGVRSGIIEGLIATYQKGLDLLKEAESK